MRIFVSQKSLPRFSDRFQLLAHQFNLLVGMIDECEDLKERMHLFRCTRHILSEIDDLILTTLKEGVQDASSSPPLEQPRAES